MTDQTTEADLIKAEESKLSAALDAYREATERARPDDDASDEVWADWHALDAAEWRKYRGVFWEVQDARGKRHPRTEATR